MVDGSVATIRGSMIGPWFLINRFVQISSNVTDDFCWFLNDDSTIYLQIDFLLRNTLKELFNDRFTDCRDLLSIGHRTTNFSFHRYQ